MMNFDRAEGHQGEVGDNPGIAIIGEHHDLVSLPYPAAPESLGEQQHILEQLAVRDPVFLFAHIVDEGVVYRIFSDSVDQKRKKGALERIVRQLMGRERDRDCGFRGGGQGRLGHGFCPQCTPMVPHMNFR